MTRRAEIPQFGLLQGLKVVVAATSIAGPFCGVMLADHGADVIWLEHSSSPAMERNNPEEYQLAQDRRNMRNLAINASKPEGKEVFLRLMKETDIFVESSKGGQWDRWGLSDEVLWEVNPKLTIVHLTGYGLTGDPAFLGKASFDPVGQAFSGMMYANYLPGTVPRPAYPGVLDYYAGFFCLFSALSGYISAEKTGHGDSFDLAQFETSVRCNPLTAMYDYNLPEGHPRRFEPGIINARSAGYNAYECADGEYVYMMILSAGVMERAFPIFGLEYGTEEFPRRAVYREYEEEGIKLEAAIKAFCAKHTAEEVEKMLSDVDAPVSRMIKYDQMLKHPHYIARDSLTVCQNSRGEDVICSNIVPKVKKKPGQVWCKAPSWGEDNEDIMRDLGYGEEDISALYAAKVLGGAKAKASK